jgi:hypothetical protein
LPRLFLQLNSLHSLSCVSLVCINFIKTMQG